MREKMIGFMGTFGILTVLGSCGGSAPRGGAEVPDIPNPAGVAGTEEAAQPEDLAFFLRRLVDLDRLPIIEQGVRTRQFSSYDRSSRYDETTGEYVNWDANGDAGHYLRTEPNGEAVMAEMDGPGCIWRIWSANPQGMIRFYFDGAAAPSLELDFNELFSGQVTPFVRPLVWQRRVVLGGNNPASNSYLPIPFATSCRITADKAHNQYYHIGYSIFPKTRNVVTFPRELSAEQVKALDRVVALLSKAGADPQPAPDLSVAQGVATIEPGDTAILAELTGPAVVHQFEAKLATSQRWGRRTSLLEIFWDGAERLAVQAPVADFFGDAWAESPYESLPMGITEKMDYSYFRMPFAESALIRVTNHGRKTVGISYRIAYRPGPIPPHAGRFHARWRRDRTSADFDYPILQCEGAGRFVGLVLFPHNIVGGWWGEGDEKVYVDGEKFPSTFGTGSEDYFGDAWGIRHFVNPFHGCPSLEEAPHQSCYRWHIADSIPFAASLKLTIENYTALRTEPVRNDYSSMAYWYQLPGGSDFFQDVPPSSLVPQGRVILGAVEAEESVDASALAAGVSVITDDDLPVELSGGKALKLAGPAGLTVPLTIQAPEDGPYAIETIFARDRPASKLALVKDGQPIGEKIQLAGGPNRFDLSLSGQPVAGDQCEAIVDCFLLHPYKNFVRRWYLAGTFDNKNGEGFDRVYGPETEPFDPKQTFRGMGGDVVWRRVEVPSGAVTKDGNFFATNDDIVVYAYCEIDAPEAMAATAYAGSDDGIKVWINGELVHRNPPRRPLVPDQDRFAVNLRQGRNTILLKVDQGGGPWGFAFRIADPDEKLRVILPE